MAFDAPAAAHEIAAASRAAARATGRLCRLREVEALTTLLVALTEQPSIRRAATLAGLSPTGVARWYAHGRQPDAPLACQLLASAMDQATAAVPFAPGLACADSDSPPPVVVTPTAPPDVPAPVVPAEVLARWWATGRHIERLTAQGAIQEAAVLRQHLQADLASYHVSAVPPQPPATMPRGLSTSEVEARYLRWCVAHGLEGPSETQLYFRAAAWYRDQLARSADHAAPGSHGCLPGNQRV